MDVKNQLEDYIKAHVSQSVDLTTEENQKAINKLSNVIELEVENNNAIDFIDFIELELAIQIIDNKVDFLEWIYDEPGITQNDVIRDFALYGNIDAVVKSKMSDFNYQLEEDVIISVLL